MRLPTFFALIACAAAAPFAALAQDAAPEITQATLDQLAAEADRNPNNLDIWFDYARAAQALGKLDEAEAAYRHMLSVRNDIPRVKLDLGLILFHQRRYAEAEALFNEVKASNPPESVVTNIDTMLKRVEDETKVHQFSSGVMAGINYDTNANASPSSGNIQFLNFIIPLENSTLAKSDFQHIGAISAGYNYRIFDVGSPDSRLVWKNMATGYISDQVHLDTLDTKLYNITSGIEWQQLAWGSVLGLDASYTHVELDGEKYLTIGSLTTRGKYALTPNLLVGLDLTAEDRNFFNAPAVTVYSLRTGDAAQARASLMFAATDNDLFTADITARRENTQVEYYDNKQFAWSMGYTRIVTPRLSGSISYGQRESNYDEPEFIISPDTRVDYERILSIGFNYNIPDWALTLGFNYQYRQVDSNILNYDYNNTRIGTTASLSF